MHTRKLIAAIAIGFGTALVSTSYAAQDEGKHKQSVGEYTSDAVLTTKIKAAIVAEKSLSALDIAVETNNGVATLTGTVGTGAQADLAARVARDVQGVKQVRNNIKVDAAKKSGK